MKTKILFIAALWPLALPSGWAETSRVFGYDAHKVTEEVDQQQRIVGRVIDAKTNEPLMGAAVILQQANEGTVTDIEGNFTLQTRHKAPYSLQVQYVGYHPQVVEVSEAGKTIEIRLVEDSQQLNEVVVVGYGTQKRKELTGAIASVDKELLAQLITNFDNLLGGAVSGLQVSESSGLPGASSNIRIRGGNSITGGNEPLYVIDGVLIYNDKSATSTGVTRATSDFNPLSAINPNDIERIEVLKDVSATAIYGSRGANGVIIVTTKSGKKGRTSIEYQYAIGWQIVAKKLDLLNACEWGDLYLEIATPTQIANSGLTPEIVAAWGEGDDWQSAALRTATTQNHQLSISGGDERTRYLISGNFSDQDGILVNTGFKRYSGRVNFGSLDYILSGSQIIQKGEPLGAFYGWQYDGLVQPGEDLSKVPVPSPKPNVEYGDAKFVDQNGDGEITQSADRVVLGSIQPDFTYGLSTTLRYKDWSLFASFQGSQGNEIYNSLRQRLESPSTSYNGSRVLLDRWSESNLTATQPKAYASNNYSNYVDSRYIEDASYFRLKNVTLSYFLPIHWQRAQQLKVKLFLSANNLFTLTGYKGYDPEVASGVDAGAYPTARTYTVGANISF